MNVIDYNYFYENAVIETSLMIEGTTGNGNGSDNINVITFIEQKCTNLNVCVCVCVSTRARACVCKYERFTPKIYLNNCEGCEKYYFLKKKTCLIILTFKSWVKRSRKLDQQPLNLYITDELFRNHKLFGLDLLSIFWSWYSNVTYSHFLLTFLL